MYRTYEVEVFGFKSIQKGILSIERLVVKLACAHKSLLRRPVGLAVPCVHNIAHTNQWYNLPGGGEPLAPIVRLIVKDGAFQG